MHTSRRHFLRISLASAACGLARSVTASNETASPNATIDTHVYLGHWPHRQLASEKPITLVAELRSHRVMQAWAGSFDGLFHKDVASVNMRLAEECKRNGGGTLVPFGTVNPTLPDWEDDVRRCHEMFHMPGVRLHPNYHGYLLDDARFTRLLELAAARRLIVQLVASMEDERHLFLNPKTQQVDLTPLAEQVARWQKLRIVVANCYRSGDDDAIRPLLRFSQIYFDFGRMKDAKDIERLINRASTDRVVFGSCAPLHSFESTRIKLDSADLTVDSRRDIASKNALRLVGG